MVSAIEHKCVLAAAKALEKREGFTVEMVPVDGEGFVDLGILESMLDGSVLTASIMAVNNEVGTIQDLPAIAALLAGHGIIFHCDAAQAPCAMNVSQLAEYADLIFVMTPMSAFSKSRPQSQVTHLDALCHPGPKASSNRAAMVAFTTANLQQWHSQPREHNAPTAIGKTLSQE